MAIHSIEPGQRLETLVGGQTRFVQVLAEAVVPAGYWICREEASGQSRVIAQTALSPVAVEPVEPIAIEPVTIESIAVHPVAVGPIAVHPVAVGPIAMEPIAAAPMPQTPAEALITAAA